MSNSLKIFKSTVKDFLISLCVVFLAMFVISCEEEEADAPTVFVESIEVTGEEITEGTTRQMTVTIMPENANDKSVTWNSSDPSVAAVSSGGLVTALKNGIVTISATANDRATITGSTTLKITSFDGGGSGETSADYIVNTSAELLAAISAAQPGEVIEMQGGTYELFSKIRIVNSGTAEQMITLRGAMEGGRPKLDFSAMSESSSNQGMVVEADFWHIKGIDFFRAGDNGMQVKGNNNLIEFCTFSECSDTGLQIDNGASNNTILNCDSYFNADSSIENADGFACKLTAGTGNKFIGCRAWNNLDDGWDGYLRGTDNITTTYENCWAIRNGLIKDGTVGGGDGNGFKTGGSDDKLLKHNAIYTNCLAIENVVDGFDHNSNRGVVTIYNCSAYGNGRNYNFSNTNPLEKLILKNSLALGDFGSTNATTQDITNNNWTLSLTVTEEDFENIDVNELLSPRKADGSLPDIGFMHLTAGSDLIDKGVDVGLEFNGVAPDLGAFEFNN
ncbi:pectate lyase [Marivirga lumbricoides]|uniref:Pectate lyase n=1 Tax=Marivirga lumbricoides TaxID=1046115 RepID=A0A2T4DTY8_9BACT|nr:pectate lyase [Marivirga lumbricoides]